MEEIILIILGDIPTDSVQILMKIFDSGLTTGILGFISYMLWKDLKEERLKNDQLTDKIITNNIVMQEQLKDIIEHLKSK